MAGPYGCAKSGNRSNQIDGMKNSSASRLLVTLGWIALEPIDKPCLGRAEKEPVAAGLLQRDKELLAPVDHRCFLSEAADRVRVRRLRLIVMRGNQFRVTRWHIGDKRHGRWPGRVADRARTMTWT